MNPPPFVSTRSPKRNTSKRTPLQERSPSEANVPPRRVARHGKDVSRSNDVASDLYPTKAAQVLLPSSIRKQSTGKAENTFLSSQTIGQFPSGATSTSIGRENGERPTTGNAPALTLTRSVAALRDLYETQAENSRPSTAASPALRPTTSNPRLKTFGSGEWLQGKDAWEALRKVSTDDLALLPSLEDTRNTVKRILSDSSSQSREARNHLLSSPNFVAIGSASSPKIPVCNDLSSPGSRPKDLALDSWIHGERSSSPNFLQFDRSSSLEDPTEQSSSPNVVRLRSSSPSNVTTALSSSPPYPGPFSSSPNKRKRADGTTFAARAGTSDAFSSNPPCIPSVAPNLIAGLTPPQPSVRLRSSPPGTANASHSVQYSSPTHDAHRMSSESSDIRSLAEMHAHLQAALDSSPAPSIRYPVIRAPISASSSGLTIPKRPPRIAPQPLASTWISRLSTVPPSETSASRSDSKRSSFGDDLDDLSDTNWGYAPSRPVVTANPISSRIRMVTVSDTDDDHHESADEVSALPEPESQYRFHFRPPPLARSSSYLAAVSSTNTASRLDSLRNGIERVNSMRSFANSRHGSVRISAQRPSSSSSATSNIQVPTWARRYYSGVYRDTFQHMYSSADVSSTSNVTALVPGFVRPSTAISRRSKRSDHSLRDHFPLNLFRPKTRPRLEARKSHLEPGVGPLVSNPVSSRPPPPAAIYSNPRLSHFTGMHSTTGSHHQSRRTSSFHPADPRYHWAGITPEQLQALKDAGSSGQSTAPPSRHSTLIPRRSRGHDWSPHLYGNTRTSLRLTRSKWLAPSVAESGEQWFSWRNAQAVCFLVGFVCPLGWFAGAFLRLPPRPDRSELEVVYDPEKRSGAPDVELETHLRRKMARVEQIRWENARWWRGLNRFMCAVGVVVIAVVITLAVLVTKT